MARGQTFPFAPPNGCVWRGTLLKQSGTWREVRGMRFVGSEIEPIRFDLSLQLTGTVLGEARTILPWTSDNFVRAHIGTEQGIYRARINAGDIIDVTPTFFEPGSDVNPDLWHIDFSETIKGPYAVFETEGVIYAHVEGEVPMAQLANAPSCYGLVCSYIPGQPPIALRARANDRLIAWPDNEDHTDWTSSTTNSAGDLQLSSTSPICCGRTFLSTVLIWTQTDLHVGQYTSGEYAFREVGRCRLLGKNSIAVTEYAVYWLGANEQGQIEVFAYDGAAIRNIDCPLADLAERELKLGNANRKVFAAWHPTQNEIWWWFEPHDEPESPGLLVTQYAIVYNYQENVWFTGFRDGSGTRFVQAFGSEGSLSYGISVSDSNTLYKSEGSSFLQRAILWTNLFEPDPDTWTLINGVTFDIDGNLDALQVITLGKPLPMADTLNELQSVSYPGDVPDLSAGRMVLRSSSPYGIQLYLNVGNTTEDDWRMGAVKILLNTGARRR